MTDTHEPDPRFVDRLEWQLGNELRRRGRAGAFQRPAFRVLKIAGLMLGSVALGAAAMGASQQIGESWRRELIEARLEVQVQLARQRLQVHLDALGLTREQVAQGVRSDQDLLYFEYQIAEAETEAATKALELEEVRRTGREPLGELSSPLVNGRDFVSERIRLQMHLADHHLDMVRQQQDVTRRQADAGVVGPQDVEARDLVAGEAELALDALAQKLDLRRAYLDHEISAVEAELKVLEVEAENEVAALAQQRQYMQAELDRFQPAVRAGSMHPAALAQLESRLAEIEAELRLAQAELEIVRRELERRGGER